LRAGRPLRPCPTIQTNAQGPASAQGLYRSRAARHRAANRQGGRGATEIPAAGYGGAGEPAAGAEAKGPEKLYSLHEPAVDCISKGKAHKRYEFGTKVSVATTTTGGFVVGMRSLPGNPYDGHTLHEALEQVEILTDQRPDMAFVDRGYRGHGVETVKVFISGARRGITRTIAKLLRRRSAIEPMIGHMKTDGRLTRCPLKGTTGDAIFAVLCGCGHNIRMILRHLRAFLCQLVWLLTLRRGFTQGAYRHQALQFAA